jgi:hypothetical protein
MEQYIKNNLSDISYPSELILDTNTTTFKRNLTCQGLIRPYNLRSLTFRKLWAY